MIYDHEWRGAEVWRNFGVLTLSFPTFRRKREESRSTLDEPGAYRIEPLSEGHSWPSKEWAAWMGRTSGASSARMAGVVVPTAGRLTYLQARCRPACASQGDPTWAPRAASPSNFPGGSKA